MQPLPNQRIEAQGVFAANGTLTVTVSVAPGYSWNVKQISVSATSALQSTCSTYVGLGASGVFISSTLLGNSDTDSEPNTTVRVGESLSAVWAGGTPGAIGRLTVIYDEVAY